MALREQATGRIGYIAATVAVIAIGNELLGAAGRTQAERLVAQYFVLRKAIVKLNNIDIFGADAGALVYLLDRIARHAGTDHRNQAWTAEDLGTIRRHRLISMVGAGMARDAVQQV